MRRLLPPLNNAIGWRASTDAELAELTNANVDAALSTYVTHPGTPYVAATLFDSLGGTFPENLTLSCHESGERAVPLPSPRRSVGNECFCEGRGALVGLETWQVIMT